MTFPVFITYRDRPSMLRQCLASLLERGFDDITVIDNDSELAIRDHMVFHDIDVVGSDNRYGQLAPWGLGLVPTDKPYYVMDCDVTLNCPKDVEKVLLRALDECWWLPVIGLSIRTDDVPHYKRYEHSLENENELRNAPSIVPGVLDAPVDTHFGMYRAGVTQWPGICGARLDAPYLCRHLPWYNEFFTKEELTYYRRLHPSWAFTHSAGDALTWHGGVLTPEQ